MAKLDHSMCITGILLFHCLTFSGGESSPQETTPEVQVSSGIHLRKLQTVAYTNSAPIIFELDFHFSEFHGITQELQAATARIHKLFKHMSSMALDDMLTFGRRIIELRNSFEFINKTITPTLHNRNQWKVVNPIKTFW